VLQILNSKNVKDGVADHELDIESDLEEDAWEDRNKADANMPGAKHNAKQIKRRTKLAIRVKAVKFSPDGTSFACATTEGLLIYSLRPEIEIFNPVEIDENVTIDNIIANVKAEQYLTAIIVRYYLFTIVLAFNENE
jgi:periodic tryptophan protein 2